MSALFEPTEKDVEETLDKFGATFRMLKTSTLEISANDPESTPLFAAVCRREIARRRRVEAS